MISFLKGKIIELDFSYLTILVDSGVGYEVLINEITFSNLTLDSNTELFIYHHKSENSENLFGFLEREEKDIFKELIKISGIGGKVALSILSIGVRSLSKAVLNGDNKVIESIKGIGKKMAEKIILELKDKDFVKNLSFQDSSSKKESIINKDLYNSIKDSLVSMGYREKQVDDILINLPEEIKDMGSIMSYVIKELS